MRRLFVLAALLFALPAHATIIINNGLAPPNPANVIDDETGDRVFVANVGCSPADQLDPCPEPLGDPTTVALVDGGSVGFGYGDLKVFGSSAIIMTGGSIGDALVATQRSTITMSGGLVDGGGLHAQDEATITMRGGTVIPSLYAAGSSTIIIVGSGFEVDTGSGPIPVPYGDLAALTGTLTGTLASGDSINNVFYQGGYSEPWFGPVTGTIRLVPEPSTAINIKPGNDTNPINPFSRGIIPVAILTTEDFDALTVDEDSVLFGPDEAEKRHKRGHVEDVDGDGDLDLLLHFRTQDTGIALGDTEACVTGETFDGVPFEGCDFVRTVPPE